MKKELGVHLKMLRKCVYEPYIFDIYLSRGFGIRQPIMVDMP